MHGHSVFGMDPRCISHFPLGPGEPPPDVVRVYFRRGAKKYMYIEFKETYMYSVHCTPTGFRLAEYLRNKHVPTFTCRARQGSKSSCLLPILVCRDVFDYLLSSLSASDDIYIYIYLSRSAEKRNVLPGSELCPAAKRPKVFFFLPFPPDSNRIYIVRKWFF